MMARSKSMKSAAVLQIVLSILDAAFALPILAAGAKDYPLNPAWKMWADRRFGRVCCSLYLEWRGCLAATDDDNLA
jgi:hypothetical protein